MKTGWRNWCRGVFGVRKAVAAVAIGLGVLAGNLPAANVITVSADTYIEKDFLVANNSASQKLQLRNNGTGGGSQVGLVYFDIPEATLQAFSDAWDAANSANPNGFGNVKAVLQLNSVQRASSGNVRVLKATKDWHTNPSAANWGTWSPVPGHEQPTFLEGIPSFEEPIYKHIGIGNNLDSQINAKNQGTLQIGATAGQTGQGVTRSILDWARNAGVGPTSAYSGQGVEGNDPQNVPNNGFAIVAGGGSQFVEITSSEYAAVHGQRYAPKLIMYKEPSAPADNVRVWASTGNWDDPGKILDVYQMPTMTSTVGGPSGPLPKYPTQNLPAPQGATDWNEAGYNITGAGWNSAPDSKYNIDSVVAADNITPGAAIPGGHNSGIFGTPGTGQATTLDKRFFGTPNGTGGFGDAAAREDGGSNTRHGYLFRTTFDAPNAADVDIVRLKMVYNGATRVYLNGTEVLDMGFNDEAYRVGDEFFGSYENNSQLGYASDFPDYDDIGATAETAEIYLDDPAFAGLLLPTGNVLAFMSSKPTTDTNSNFKFGLNSVDLLYNTDILPEGIDGDLDGDGFVGQSDLNLILGNWGQSVPPGDPLADYDGSGAIGQGDLNAVLGNWGQGDPPIAAVPEPASLLLMGLAGIGMACIAAKRRNTGK